MNHMKKADERGNIERLCQGFIAPVAAKISGPGKAVSITGKEACYNVELQSFASTSPRVVDVSRECLLNNRVVALDDDHPAADRFKLLRTQVFQRTRSKGWNIIQVSGFGVGEGKSTVAVNLAASIARDTRQTALLVDLDFRNPSIDRLLNINGRSPGLKSYFLDDTPLSELLVNPGIDKLAVITSGGKMTQATELLGSPKMEALITALKHHNDRQYVIFDTPGVTTCPDPLIISEYADAILLVGKISHTTKESITAAIERIPKRKLLGIVMNNSPEDDSRLY